MIVTPLKTIRDIDEFALMYANLTPVVPSNLRFVVIMDTDDFDQMVEDTYGIGMISLFKESNITKISYHTKANIIFEIVRKNEQTRF